jgi:serine phosphatase RsbU (regulator of sigma subunit)
MKILCDNCHCGSAEIVQKLVQGVDSYLGSAEQTDDITIVLLRVL